MPPQSRKSSDLPACYHNGAFLVREPDAPLFEGSLGFDASTHLHRFLQSSSDMAGQDSPPAYAREPSRQHRSTNDNNNTNNNNIAVNCESHEDAIDMEEGLSDKDQQLLKSFLAESIREATSSAGLLRYHSAPSSTLTGIAHMGNHEFYSPNGEFARLLREDVMSAFAKIDSKKTFAQMDESGALRDDVGRGEEGGVEVNRVSRPEPSHLVSSHARFKRAANVNNGTSSSQLHPGVGMEVQSEDQDSTNTGFAPALIHASSSNHLTESSTAQRVLPALGPTYPTTNTFGVGRMSSEDSGNIIATRTPTVRHSNNNGSSLLRHSSSPPGLMSNVKDGYVDNGNKLLPSLSMNSSEEGSFDRRAGHVPWEEGLGSTGCAVVGSATTSSTFGAKKRVREFEEKCSAGSNFQDSSQPKENTGHGALTSHVNMPIATSPENLFFLDKLSSDSVPCRSRAKRGCATHPRSIAERVRRTKISERMKRLQELVPEMDKQTNIAEMLDEAVEYVKVLQQQVQELKESQSKCTCSFRQKESSPQ